MIDSAKVYPLAGELAHYRVVTPEAQLTQIDPGATFDASKFAIRDGELSWRDLAVASSFLQVALKASTVWSFSVDRPRISAVPVGELDDDSAERLGTAVGNVVHVLNSSIPYDAVVSDKYLYNRDSILNEVIVRASAVLTEMSLTSVFPDLTTDVAWSRAEGQLTNAGVSRSVQLNQALFKDPDRHLAERDNELAGCVARLVHALMNPFDVAARLFIEVVGSNARLPEVYSLSTETSEERVWTAEPAVNGRMRVVYNKRLKTLKWVDESSAPAFGLAQPIPVPLSVDGVAAGTIGFQNTVEVKATTPARQDSSIWAQKASRINFSGELEDDPTMFQVLSSIVSDQGSSTPEYGGDVVMTRSGTVKFQMTGVTFPVGKCRVSFLVKPDVEFQIAGEQNVEGHTGTLGGATLPTGGGVITWRLSLPPVGWKVSVGYSSNQAGSATFSGVASGALALQSGTHLSSQISFTGVESGVFRLDCTGNAGLVLTVSHLLFESADEASLFDYSLVSVVEGSTARQSQVEFSGTRRRPDVISFNFDVGTPVVNPVIAVSCVGPVQPAVLRFLRLSAQAVNDVTPTLGLAGFEYWKYEMVTRAGQTAANDYSRNVGITPVFDSVPFPTDNFDDRGEILIVSAGKLIGSNAKFTKETGEPEHAGNAGGRSGWWKWVAKSSGLVTLRALGSEAEGVSNSGCSFDTLLAVYTGSSVDNLTLVAQSGTGVVDFVAEVGIEYQIVVDGYDGAYGVIAIEMATSAPSNDSFATALEVTGFARNIKFSTGGATKETGEDDHGGEPGGKSAWISWTSSFSGSVVVDTTASDFSAVIGVYTGASVSTVVPVSRGEPFNSGQYQFTAVSGTTYKIAVDDAANLGGNAVVHIYPEYREYDSQYIWTALSVNCWMAYLSAVSSGVSSTFRLATPSDVGKPALVPRGVSFDDGTGYVAGALAACESIPEIVVLQPWMVEVGFYVAKREFWPAEAGFSVDESAVEVEGKYQILLEANPSGAGFVSPSSGLYSAGALDISATASGALKDSVLGAADIVFMVDEGTTMDAEHDWIAGAAQDLQDQLISLGVGVDVENQWGLVGFVDEARKIEITSGNEFGDIDEFKLKARRQVNGGELGGGDRHATSEDGYRAIGVAVDDYTWRTGAAHILVLITDEERDLTAFNRARADAEGYSYAATLARLQSVSAVFAVVVSASMKSNSGAGVELLGMLARSARPNVGYGETTGGFQIYDDTAVATTGEGQTIQDYVDLADEVFGSSWDISQLRTGGATLESFTGAFVAVVSDQGRGTQYWTFSTWTSTKGDLLYTPAAQVLISAPATYTATFV